MGLLYSNFLNHQEDTLRVSIIYGCISFALNITSLKYSFEAESFSFVKLRWSTCHGMDSFTSSSCEPSAPPVFGSRPLPSSRQPIREAMQPWPCCNYRVQSIHQSQRSIQRVLHTKAANAVPLYLPIISSDINSSTWRPKVVLASSHQQHLPARNNSPDSILMTALTGSQWKLWTALNNSSDPLLITALTRF